MEFLLFLLVLAFIIFVILGIIGTIAHRLSPEGRGEAQLNRQQRAFQRQRDAVLQKYTQSADTAFKSTLFQNITQLYSTTHEMLLQRSNDIPPNLFAQLTQKVDELKRSEDFPSLYRISNIIFEANSAELTSQLYTCLTSTGGVR